MDRGEMCQATPKLTPRATLKLTPSWTLVKEGIWTTSTPIWLTCLTRRRTKRMYQMSTCDRRRRTPGCSNLLIFGPPGVGKSHLAIGLGRKVVEQGHTVRFTTATALLSV